MSNPCNAQLPGDGHTSPCQWSKSIMWMLAIIIAMGAWLLGMMTTRLSAVEKQTMESREALAAMRASMEYISRDINDIKLAMRTEKKYTNVP